MSIGHHTTVWPVAIFAHNEGRFIIDSINSVVHQRDIGAAVKIYVLANGCSDDTEEHVAEFAKGRDDVELVSIKTGDKSNAWNVYVHELALEHDIHFFLDGDTRAHTSALSELAKGLETEPQANGAAAFPFIGRSKRQWSNFIRTQRGMPGCLYALRGSFVDRVRTLDVKLPVGFIGEDVLLQFLVKSNLAPERKRQERERITLCEEAGFEFDTMSGADFRDWKLYWKRNVRNAEREHQSRLLMPLLQEKGLGAMPRRVEQLYEENAAQVRFRWSGIDTLFHWFVVKKIRRHRS